MYILTLRATRARYIQRKRDRLEALCRLIERNAATDEDLLQAQMLTQLLHQLDNQPAGTIAFATYELAAEAAQAKREPFENISQLGGTLAPLGERVGKRSAPGRGAKAIGKHVPRWLLRAQNPTPQTQDPNPVS